GIDHNLIDVVFKALQQAMRQAETPVFVVIGGAVRDEIRLLRQGMEVFPQLPEAKASTHRHAIAYDVQVALGEIDNLAAVAFPNVGVPYVPLARYRPVKRLGPGRHLVDLDIGQGAKPCQSLAYAIASDAATDRVDFRGEGIDPFANAVLRK